MSDRLRRLWEPKDSSLNWSCGFSRTPSDPTCLAAAAWHGFVLTEDGQDIIAMMASCDEHEAAMAVSADYVHSMDTPCGLPGSRFIWPENVCRVTWDAEQLAGEAVHAGQL